MIDAKRILGVIPARGGSKGVPLKNIRLVDGVPLIAMAAPVVAALPEIDRTVVSTDHAEIARVAREAGLAVPFVRPEPLSGDRVADWDVLVHALHEMEQQDRVTYDVITMLQPTSPLRTAQHVRDTLVKLVKGGYDSVWTVSEMDPKLHPLKALALEDGEMRYFDPRGAGIVARQQLSKTYYRNGLCYAFTRACLVAQKAILGRKAGAVVVEEPVVNIDTLADFERLEEMVRARRGERGSRG